MSAPPFHDSITRQSAAEGAEMKRLVRILWVTPNLAGSIRRGFSKARIGQSDGDRETSTPLLSSFQEAIQTSNR